MDYILEAVRYIFKHSSGLDTVEYLSRVHHQEEQSTHK